MGLIHCILFFQLAVLVYGDLLVDYANQKLEGLPNWIVENVQDEFSFTTQNHSSNTSAFMSYNLKTSNITVSGLTRVLSMRNNISGSLFSGSLTIKLEPMMYLELSGNYEVTGTLFPYGDQIPYTTSGTWSSFTSYFFSTLHDISMKLSSNGSMSLMEFNRTRSVFDSMVLGFEFDNFLEDHINQWYYPTLKDGFWKAFEAHTHVHYNDNLNEKINVYMLEKYFEETFKNINYSDIVGNQP